MLRMIRRIDRQLLRVPSLESAVRYYRDVLGFILLKQDKSVATLRFAHDEAELVLHTDPDLPAEATFYLVDSVEDLYRRREELKLQFSGPPARVSRGWRGTVRDPFGNVLLIIDRSGTAQQAPEDARPASTMLFAGIEQRHAPNREAISRIYEKVGRTADDLPYTPQFESLYNAYIQHFPEPHPSR